MCWALLKQLSFLLADHNALEKHCQSEMLATGSYKEFVCFLSLIVEGC